MLIGYHLLAIPYDETIRLIAYTVCSELHSYLTIISHLYHYKYPHYYIIAGPFPNSHISYLLSAYLSQTTMAFNGIELSAAAYNIPV